MGNTHSRGDRDGSNKLKSVGPPVVMQASSSPLPRSSLPRKAQDSLPSLAGRQPRTERPSFVEPLDSTEVSHRLQKQQPSSLLSRNSVHSGRGRDGDMREEKKLTSQEKVDHIPSQLSVLRDLSRVTSSGSMDTSIVSHNSYGSRKPQLTVNEARELLLSIFVPRQGELECIFSGFLTWEVYAGMRGLWLHFLNMGQREKWYLDAVMLSLLGEDSWRSLGVSKEAILSVSPTREEVLRANEQRRVLHHQLRERLMNISGTLIMQSDHGPRKEGLDALREKYNSHKRPSSTNSVDRLDISYSLSHNCPPDGDMVSCSSITSDGSFHSHDRRATQTPQRWEIVEVMLMRIKVMVSISCDCFDLIATGISTAITSLPRQYLLNSAPVVYGPVGYKEQKIGELDSLSFFVSIESRRRLLNGDAPVDARHTALTSKKRPHHAALDSPVSVTCEDGVGPIQTTQQLYSAVRHAGLVLTTACSSLVLNVLLHLADALRERRAFRNAKTRAAKLGATLGKLTDCQESPARLFSGRALKTVQEMKRCVVEGEMPLPVFAKELVTHFRRENRDHMENLYRRHRSLLAPLEAAATADDQKGDCDAAQLLGGITLKLMFLTGGGQRSIMADDRRALSSSRRITDDVALSRMLEVPILSRICWVANMMGLPITANNSYLTHVHQEKPLSFMEIDECCGVVRVLFQAVGALPSGDACPRNMKDWFPLFPFYSVNSDGKRALMYLYTAQVTAIQRVPLRLKKDMTLLSFANAFKAAKGRNRVDISNYFFEPNFAVGSANSTTTGVGGSTTSTLETAAAGASPLLKKRKSPHTSTRGMPTEIGGQLSSRSDEPMPLSVSSASAPLTEKVDPRYTAANTVPASCELERFDSSTSGSSFTSCSTLMDENLNVDVYTCMNLQSQLYLRCSNEAAVRRHRITELTPSVRAKFYSSSRALLVDRPDISPVLLQAVPKLLPSEGLLTVRWTSGEPLVTFCVGDVLSVMAERMDALEPSVGGASGTPSSPPQLPTLAPSRHYSTASNALLGNRNAGVVTTQSLPTSCPYFYGYYFSGGATSEDEPAMLSNGSYAGTEMLRARHRAVPDLFGAKKKEASTRLVVRWTVVGVWGCDPPESVNTFQKEAILHVTTLDMPRTVSLHILTMGHERASTSVFTYIHPDDDAVCWSNPNLIESIIDKSGYTAPGSEGSISHAKGKYMQASNDKRSRLVPSLLRCDTEEALHNVYYAIGVLLGNTITNGVFFTVPIAPLAFFLMQKAISSGDYSFRNFMWLEPADGNLLSSAMVLNAALELYNMTDHQYTAFLRMRSLDGPDLRIFPVIHSLADEVRERRTERLRSQSRSQSQTSLSSQHHQQQRQRQPRGSRSVDISAPTDSITSPGAANPLSRPLRRGSESTNQVEYAHMIRMHNSTGSAFHRTRCDLSSLRSNSSTSVSFSLGGEDFPLLDRPKDQRHSQQQLITGKGLQLPILENRGILHQPDCLPSRREYISLYLVNDLIWSSVRRDGRGEINRELWVSMARGFMTSSLANSPLLTHCCARVIQEVLCIPDAGS